MKKSWGRIPVYFLLATILGGGTALGEFLPGGTLDPTTIPKFVIPLVIPPVMKDVAGDNTTNDYEIAVREFKQQILPGGIWNTINGRNDKFNPTRVWSYGPAADPTPTVAPSPDSQFNYPAYTIETLDNRPYVPENEENKIKVRWINDLVDDKGKYLNHLLPVDQTVHWANPPQECRHGEPRTDCSGISDELYEGPVPIITHVHGAHVEGHSDGYPEAWWLPAAKNIPKGYATEGRLFDDSEGQEPQNSGYVDFSYRNDQPATTLWYHDHTLGMTRLNVYAGPAGFWLIRGGENDGARIGGTGADSGNPAVLPGPAPVAGQELLQLNVPGDTVRNGIREIPVAIQDRSFDRSGNLFYPKFRAFFEGIDKGQLKIDFASFSDVLPHWQPEAFFNVMVVNGVSWPELEVAPALYRFRLLNGCNSRFLNLALFVVDGPGDDGVMGTEDDELGDELPLYQIGAEQGFLKKVVKIQTGFATELPGDGSLPVDVPAHDPEQALLMGLAERADVLVDFRGLPANTIVRMINTAPDEPFGGFNSEAGEDAVADLNTSGQVMQFLVNPVLLNFSKTDPGGASPAISPEYLILNSEGGLLAADNEGDPRNVSLNEKESETVCVLLDVEADAFIEPIRQVPCNTPDPDADGETTEEEEEEENGGDGVGTGIDVVPFGPTEALLGQVNVNGEDGPEGIPLKWTDDSGPGSVTKKVVLENGGEIPVSVTENPNPDAVEEWDIYNFTADAHPIHLHLVRFEVVKRTDFEGNEIENRSVMPWETGFKDTVIAYPDEITTVKAHFDIPGLYVWHCHIVEHEDNEMMRPYVVGLETIENED